MSNLGVLYKYELKKLFKRRIVWVTLIIAFTASALSMILNLCGYAYVDGVKLESNYDAFLVDKGYQMQLDGREIDQTLLEEMLNAYSYIPDTEKKYSTTEEYQKYARPYSAIFNFVRDMTQMTVSDTIKWKPDTDDLYNKRRNLLESNWVSEGLSEGEKQFWLQKEAKISTPYVYRYTEGYYMILISVATNGLLTLMSVSICLANIFSEEHSKRTDQPILSSKNGKTAAYWSKLLAGISFSVGISLLLLISTSAIALAMYGIQGFDAMFQLIFAWCSYPLTTGQAVLIIYVCVIATAAVFGSFVMLLSELLHSNIAALSISSATLIASMILYVPDQYRILAQLWCWLPSGFLTPWNIFDCRLLSIFGHYFTSWQVVPIIYMVATVIIAFIGKPIYKRFQVSGR